jgi:LDH2 family malate/lactate/ureidoglycolate dehydrogenase
MTLDQKMAVSKITVAPDALRVYYEAVFNACGLTSEDAALVGDTLFQADLRGVYSHGLVLLPYYVSRLRLGGANPAPQLQVVIDLPGLLLVDGDGGLGQIVSIQAMHMAIERARTSGMAAVFVRNSNHFGAAAYYPMLAAVAGLIGVATTNAQPSMAMWGGRTKGIGNNPLAIAIPAGDAPPLVLDIAMSVAAGGKLTVRAKEGVKIPLGWALDPDGQPTDDPALGLLGQLLPMTDAKGTGLALIFDLLCSVLIGARDATELAVKPDVTRPQDLGHLFLAIDVNAFQPLETFYQRVDMIISRHKAMPRAEGVDEILMPGEPEHRTRQHRCQAGIPFGPGVLRHVEQSLADLEIPTPW